MPADGTYIFIISNYSLTRSLLGAQFREEGFAVTGSASLAAAVAQLSGLQIVPSLIIIETLGLDMPANALELLGQMCRGVPLLLISGAGDRPAHLTWKGASCRLTRPLTIGQIVARGQESLNEVISEIYKSH